MIFLRIICFLNIKESLRLEFDLSLMNGTFQDKQMCSSSIKKSRWPYLNSQHTTDFTCSKEDMITEQQIEYIKDVFQKLQKIISKIVKIIRRTTSIKLFNTSYFKYPEKLDRNSDLHIIVVVRPFGKYKDRAVSTYLSRDEKMEDLLLEQLF